MKKTLFLAFMSGAALVGCVKNEPIAGGDSSPGQITFDAPVVGVPTRAEEIHSNYPVDKNFAVYALYHENAYDQNSFTSGSIYMTNVTCNVDDQSNPTKWNPETDYYWPKKGLLTFAAYAPAAESGVDWGATGFTFTNFEVEDEPTEQIDLLFSDRVYDQTKASMVTSANPYTGVTIKFKHALSSIVFKAKTAADYSTNGTVITLTGITVNKVVKKGNFAQNLTAAVEVTQATDPSWTPAAYTETANVKNYVVYDNSTGKVITNTEAFVNADPAVSQGKRRSDLILIPQDLDRSGDDDDVTVTVVYKIKTGSETAVTQTQELKLGSDGASWALGKRYIYTIVIGLDKIYFNPQVDNWTDASGAEITNQ